MNFIFFPEDYIRKKCLRTAFLLEFSSAEKELSVLCFDTAFLSWVVLAYIGALAGPKLFTNP